MTRPVLVTGLGVVTGRAMGPDQFWATRHTAPPAGAALPLDEASLRHPRRDGDLVTRATLDAALQAWRDAGLPDPRAPVAAGRTGVVWGVGLAGLRAAERGVASIAAGRDPGPRDVLALSPAEPVAALARRLGVAGPCRAVATACASATDAIADAAQLIAAEVCDVVVAGGAEAGATPVNLAGLRRLGVLSRAGVARPFDEGRDGLVLAEGAAAVVLESAEHAGRRGARALATVQGWVSARDLEAGPVAPGPRGTAVAGVITTVLDDAGLTAADLAAVIAHATGTGAGDAAEAEGLAAAVGDRVPVTAGKGATGHAMAASGALAAVEALLILQHGVLAPVVNLRARTGAPEALDLVTRPRQVRPGPVVLLSAGFGGFTSAIVLGPT